MTGDLQPVRVAGVVLTDGSPQPGASVELHSWTTAARAREVDRVTTDAEGRFDLGYQDAAMSLILARHEGAEASQRFDLADPATQRSADQLVLELEPCERFVRGRVVDDGRHPLANIELHLVRNVGETALIPIGRSSSDGTFSVCAWGEVAAGGGDLGLVVLPMRQDVGDVVLVPTMIVRGHVLESDGGAVADALVWAIGNARTVGHHWGQPGSTDASGAYELRLGPGCYDMLARQDGRATYKGEHICGAPGDTVDAAPIVLDPCRLSLKGVVRHGDQPVGNTRVRLGGLTDITDNEGEFSFACAPSEALGVDGYLVEPTIDLDGKTGDLALDVHVVAGARLHGQVSSAGQPVRNARVEVVDENDVGKTTVLRPLQPWTRSGPQGQYDLRVAPGKHQVRAWDRDSRRAESRWISVGRDAADVRVDLELDRGDTLHGIARHASGKLAAGVPLSLRPKPQGAPDLVGGHLDSGTTITAADICALMGTMERTRSTTTGPDGQFGFGEVEAGSYVLEPSDRSWRLAGASGTVVVEVHAGQDNEVELVFASRRGVNLRGRVVGPDGHQLRYARVSLSLFETTIVDPDGRFTFENLAPGDYEINAVSADGALLCRSGPITAGGSPVTITLKAPKPSQKRWKIALPCDERL